ncbi:MAG: transglycosylase SLT domain-containing protein [Proteobacteria bacterium]|nr:transglycosylase SLT domain-containing protein [Pseudomonadota bacterium]
MNRLLFSVGTLAVLLAGLAHGAAAAPAAHGEAVDNSGEICRILAYRAERREGIPDQLLAAIAIVETGRWDPERKENYAWPWAVTSGGEGKFFPTKAAAIAEVRRLQAGGVQNIDVGCMQVNLLYHPDAFASLDEAFDPQANVAYAARYLKDLYRSTRSWYVAAAHYHSTNPDQHVPYRRKLIQVWDQERRLAAATYRAAAMQAYSEKREERDRAATLVAGRRAPERTELRAEPGQRRARNVRDYLRDRNLNLRTQGYPRSEYSKL